MQTIGCHIGADKYNELVDEALMLDTNTMQFFSRSSRGGSLKRLDVNDILLFNEKLKKNNIEKILIHAPFIINACSNKPNIRSSSIDVMCEDIERIEMFNAETFYVFHPGNHMKQGSEIACKYIADMLNRVIDKDQKTIILLETMAGKGTEVGKTFEELADIIKMVDLNNKLGICLDTCHVWDAGYNLDNLDDVLSEFDNIIGLDRLKYIHLNNSANICGAHKDRHTNIKDGQISIDTISKIMNNKYLSKIPKILETPENGYAEDLKCLKELIIK